MERLELVHNPTINKESLGIVIENGSKIIYRNFSGKEQPYNPKGTRNFCLLIDNNAWLDVLSNKGVSIKDTARYQGRFICIKIPRYIKFESPLKGRSPETWLDMLDCNNILKAQLLVDIHKCVVNKREITTLYLRTGDFEIAGNFGDVKYLLRMTCTPYVPTQPVLENNYVIEKEKKNMEKMTRAEVMGQLQMGINAFEMNRDFKKDPIVLKLMSAMKDAIEYLGEAPKSETKVKTVTVKEKVHTLPEIKQVIFNYPATVVIWSDGVKTVVECQKGDNYDMEKGLALCICKRMMGNQSNFNKQIRKYTDNAKNVKTKKKAKEGTFEERKAVRIAQAKANKTAKGKSKSGKDIVSGKGKPSPAIVNTDKMIVITEPYVIHVRKKMAARGLDYKHAADLAGISQAALSRWVSPNAKSQKPKRIKRECFNKLNKALGIRWKIEE